MAGAPKEVLTRSADNLNGLCGQQVSITFGDEDKQYFCFCWGVCRDRFIMTQAPVDTDIQGKLVTGATVVVRFVESGMVCGFKTRIHKVITAPFRLIFFEYPASIDAVNLRQSKRVSISLQAEIQWKEDIHEGTIRDLSEGGCFFEMKYWQDPAFKDLEVGSTFPIRFTIHGEASHTELSCKAVRVIKDQDDLRMGLAFNDDRKEAKGSIAKFVSYISKLLNA
jgi:c-di-GMP-binding flagellar brake protein YcgR